MFWVIAHSQMVEWMKTNFKIPFPLNVSRTRQALKLNESRGNMAENFCAHFKNVMHVHPVGT